MNRTKEQRFGQIALLGMVMCVLLSVCGCMRENVKPESDVYRIVFASNTGIYSINSDGTDKKRIAEEGKGIVVSPDGSRILYKTSETYEDSNLHCANIDGSGDTVLAELNSYSRYVEYEFSPDGSQVLYEADTKLYLINTDGTGQFLLTNGNYSTFSADGTRIYFVDFSREQTEDGYALISDEGICSIRLDGSDKHALVDRDLFERSDGMPFYSPDKSRFLISFSSYYEKNDKDYAQVINEKGQLSEIIDITIDAYDKDEVIRFSPDGSCLLISDVSSINNKFFFVDSDGRNNRRFKLSDLFFGKSTFIYDPVFSPDSKSFVFCAWTEWNRGNDDRVSISSDSFGQTMLFSGTNGMGEQNIYVNPVEGYDPKCLTSGIYARSPVYSQDGSKIVYVVVERTGKNADDYLEYIYIMNADGSDQQQIAYDGKINEMYVITSNK